MVKRAQITRFLAANGIVLTCAASPVAAQIVSVTEAGQAQVEMFNRIESAASAYATSIALDGSYVSYCMTSLQLQTRGHPNDGSIPYGVNYNNITATTLQTVINIREAYERNFLIVCLATAKAALNNAH
jgi:hypothetical protein